MYSANWHRRKNWGWATISKIGGDKRRTLTSAKSAVTYEGTTVFCALSATHLCRKRGSTPTVGSSRIKSSGSCIRATAKDTRRCWPPLQSERNSSANGKFEGFVTVRRSETQGKWKNLSNLFGIGDAPCASYERTRVCVVTGWSVLENQLEK